MKKQRVEKRYLLLSNLGRFALLILLIISYCSTKAQEKVWQNKKCAVVLTYDDALNTDIDNVVPLLDSLNFKATFYLSGFFPTIKTRAKEWTLIGKHGYELGNHTLFHPCDGKAPGRDWVKPDYDLSTYTYRRIVDEINMNNILLEILDGKTERTFAYTCGDMKAGDSCFVDDIKKIFCAARGVEGKMQTINEVDLYNIGSYMINGPSGDELIALVNEAMIKNALLVFLFHGVGGEHSLNVSLEAHHKLLNYLSQNQQDIWVAPLFDVAQYIIDYRKNNK
jgi:peptidoglycan-N-acetylglucosamine deacetylase